MSRRTFEPFARVDPRGSIFVPLDPNDAPNRPTILRPGQFGFRKGDPIAFFRTGSLNYGAGAGDTTKSLWCRISNGNPFEIAEEIAVINVDASQLWRLSPRDIFYKDNSDPNGDYGIAFCLVNSPPRTAGTQNRNSKIELGSFPVDEVIGTEPSEEFLTEQAALSISELPAQEGQALTPFPSVGLAPPTMKYRGWYLSDNWRPDWSMFNARRPGSIHRGVDIFALSGSAVRAPVGGRLHIDPFSGGANNSSFGRSSVIEYTKNGVIHYVIFSHLSQTSGSDKSIISSGAIIGATGCSGNAGHSKGYPCGSWQNRNRFGGRSDHLHVEIRKRSLDTTAEKLNPITEFGWAIE